MSQCVRGWDLDDGPSHPLQVHHPPSATTRPAMSDYEVAELTWDNGHLAMLGHGGGPPRVGKPSPWEKPRASGTLQAVVDQATRPALPTPTDCPKYSSCHLVPCLSDTAKNPSHHPVRANVTVPAAVDALVPCSNLHTRGGDERHPTHIVPDLAPAGAADASGTCVGSSSGRKRARLGGAVDGNCSATGSAASMGLTFDTCEINDGGDDAGFATSASPVDGSPETEDTSYGRPLTQAEDLDSVCHSRRTQATPRKTTLVCLPPPLSSPSSLCLSSKQMAAALLRQRDGCNEEEKNKGGETRRSSMSTKRSRAATIHNQSERKRRDRINQKMKTLQKLIPNSRKTDKASILDEAIEYLKQLQAQVQVMSRMSSVPHMMMPMAMQHMQMAIMAQMAQMAQMGMGAMGMGMMDINALGARAEKPGVPPAVLPPAAFLPPSGSWDIPAGDRQPPPAGAALPADPFAAFIACQNQQPTAVDAYGRMAASYRQVYQQPPGPNPKT